MKGLIALSGVMATVALCAAPALDGDVVVAQDPANALVTIQYAFTGEPAIVTVDIQTNGPAGYVSIDSTFLTNLTGDVNRKIAPGSGKTITWQPADTIPGRFKAPDARAVVTLHATNSPPDYIVLDLSSATAAGAASVRFFPNAAQIPMGVTNDIYKTRYYVMRRIHAAGVLWPMGAPNTESGYESSYQTARPWVALSEDYYIGIYEVTQGHFKQDTDLARAVSQNCSFTDREDSDLRPVNRLRYAYIRGTGSSWPGDNHVFPQDWAYPQFLRNRVGKKFLLDLPTEAQWEFACRAGHFDTRFYSGEAEADLSRVAWYTNNVPELAPQPVGLKSPNDWGLYDMLGNVEELCLDNYRPDYGVNQSDYNEVDMTGPSTDSNGETKMKVRRGGGYRWLPERCRSASRRNTSDAGSGSAYDYIGFRLAMQVAYPY